MSDPIVNPAASALPADDPAYGDMLEVLSRHGGLTLRAGPPTERLLGDLLEVVVHDRIRQAGPIPDAATLFAELTAEERFEIGVEEDASTSPESVWARSDVSPMGVYTTTVDYDRDHSRTFAPADVPRYVDTLLTAITYAEYDAAVLNQLRTVLRRRATPEARKEASSHAMSVVMGLRESRPPIDQAAVRPLLVRAAIGVDTGQPYLHARIAGTKTSWRWGRASVVQHTQNVRDVMVAADMDAAYRRLLVGKIGLDDSTARGVVGDLANWRVETTEG